METACKGFVKTTLRVTLSGLVVVMGFNVLVDPAGAFPSLHLKSFEPLRYLSHERIAKAEMARRGDWEVVILGSSRSKAGLPATHPFLSTNRTCNLSIDAARFPELVAAFDYTRQHNRLKHLLLCLDLYMFRTGSNWILDFPESRFNPRFDRFQYYCKELLGRASTDNSWATLLKKYRGYIPPPQASRGFYSHHLRPGVSQRDLFNKVLRVVGAGHARKTLDPAHLELFRHMVRVCREDGIDLQVAIMPVHALDLELLHASGRWSEFEKWKTGLVKVLAEEDAERWVGLWDFTGYAGLTAEPVPTAGDVTNRMKFYFENSHFTPTLGGILLDVVYGPGGTNAFGVKLTHTNIEQHLARTLEDRAQYVRANAAEIQWIERVAAEIAAKPK